jgi:hypothetical protein
MERERNSSWKMSCQGTSHGGMHNYGKFGKAIAYGKMACQGTSHGEEGEQPIDWVLFTLHPGTDIQRYYLAGALRTNNHVLIASKVLNDNLFLECLSVYTICEGTSHGELFVILIVMRS